MARFNTSNSDKSTTNTYRHRNRSSRNARGAYELRQEHLARRRYSLRMDGPYHKQLGSCEHEGENRKRYFVSTNFQL